MLLEPTIVPKWLRPPWASEGEDVFPMTLADFVCPSEIKIKFFRGRPFLRSSGRVDMVHLKVQHWTEGFLSERRLTSGPSSPFDKASLSPTGNLPQAASSTASVRTSISIRAQIFQSFSGLVTVAGVQSETAIRTNVKIERGVSSGLPGEINSTAPLACSRKRPYGTSQIVVLRFAGYVQESTVLLPPTEPIKLSIGTKEHILAFGPYNNSLMSFAQSLNDITGMKAWLLQTRQGLSLLLKGLPGTSNALQPESLDILRRLMQPASSLSKQPFVVSVDEIPATDAWNRSAGLASDVGDGDVDASRIVATPRSKAHLAPKGSVVQLQRRLMIMVREVNAILTFLASLANSGANSDVDVNAQDRIFAQVLLSRLRRILLRPVYGFASDPVYPADIGLRLGKDGLLEFDEVSFNKMYLHSQSLLSAMVGPDFEFKNMFLSQEAGATQTLNPAVYTLVYDPTHIPVLATLDGIPLRMCHDPLGRPVLVLEGYVQEISIVLNEDAKLSSELVYRLSLSEQLEDLAETVLRLDEGKIHSDAQLDFIVTSPWRDDAPAENTILSLVVDSVGRWETAQGIESGAIPPQAAELMFYLLWIGLFAREVDHDHRHKYRRIRRSAPNGSIIAFLRLALGGQFSEA